MPLPYACVPLDALPEPHDPAPNPEALAIQQQTRARLHDLFYVLFSLNEASVLTALYLEDWTAEQTADYFCLPYQRVRHIRQKALKVLRTNAEIRALLCPTATSAII